MTLWRLEWLRFVRTKRWVVLLGIFGFAALISPPTVRYTKEMLDTLAGEEIPTLPEFIVPPPTPEAGVDGYVSNVAQLGLLAVIIVAAGAFSQRSERAAFLRSRVRRAGDLVLPAVVVNAAVAALTYVIATGVAWLGIALMLGDLPVAAMLLGGALFCLYLTLVVCTTALFCTLIASRLGAVLATAGTLLALPILAILPPVEPWLPSELVGAPGALVRGGPAGDHVRSALVTIVACVAATVAAMRRADRREL